MKGHKIAYLLFVIALFVMCACGNRDEISEEQSSIIISEKISRDDKEEKIDSSISLSISDITQGMLLSLEQMQDIISQNKYTTVYAIKDVNDKTGEPVFEIISVDSPNYKVPQVSEIMKDAMFDYGEEFVSRAVMTASKRYWPIGSQELVMFSSNESVPCIVLGMDYDYAAPLHFAPYDNALGYIISVPKGLEGTVLEGETSFSAPLKINGSDFSDDDLEPIFWKRLSYGYYYSYGEELEEAGITIVESYHGTMKQKTVLENVVTVWLDYSYKEIDFSKHTTYQDGYASLGTEKDIMQIVEPYYPEGLLVGNAFLLPDDDYDERNSEEMEDTNEGKNVSAAGAEETKNAGLSALTGEVPKYAPELDEYYFYNPGIQSKTAGIENYRNVAVIFSDSLSGSLAQAESVMIMVISIEKSTNQVKLLNVLPNTFLKTDESLRQAKRAHLFGLVNVLKMLDTNLDLDIVDCITIGFDAQLKLLDLLGGVYINVDDYEKDAINSDWMAYVPEDLCDMQPIENSGYQLLDSAHATKYAFGRGNMLTPPYTQDIRIPGIPGGTYSQAARQQELAIAALEKIHELDKTAKANLVKELAGMIYTSMDEDELTELLDTVSSNGVNGVTIFPNEEISEKMNSGTRVGCIVPISLEDNVKQMHEYLFNEEDYDVSSEVSKISEEIRREIEANN